MRTGTKRPVPLAARFESLVSSCGPPLLKLCHQLRWHKAECAATYHVQEGDTCDSIAEVQSVPSRELLEAHDHLDDRCGGIKVGQNLCLPAQCKLHLVTPDDSCDYVKVGYGVSIDNLSEWNARLYIQWNGFNTAISGFICIGNKATYHVTTLSSAKTSGRLQTTSIAPYVKSSASESSSRTLTGIVQNEEATDKVLSSTTTEVRDSA
ncbi:hypothetical protein GCG54_00013295 [Colletotrichum gloeosporioides]|uniref:LysM domain-containing protein n=1 Tax=Colletotrichum gloeosporioides TaxID=474922 RepID=A0A8H4CG05_COLGL|nr:uncharacterized protein GCG54_00013295 [Colletotrichum gloeosporioides]KAF3803189.1 hypothetical protein GCG54_00013295 [Colletotrichum gloeosporioides]